MSKSHQGRFTADWDSPVAVFLIGMRVNRVLAVRKWLSVFRAMPPMIRELYQNQELGFLGMETFLHWRGISMLQYWRSFEHLEAYARGGIHLEAWKAFNRSIGTDGTVGIYHETYVAEPGGFENVYSNMPPFGLAKAAGRVPAIGQIRTARGRMSSGSEPGAPSPASSIAKPPPTPESSAANPASPNFTK